jgi:hypothetical protein
MSDVTEAIADIDRWIADLQAELRYGAERIVRAQDHLVGAIREHDATQRRLTIWQAARAKLTEPAQ